MKYKWRYVSHLRPITKPIPITLGSIMHEAFDLFYKGSGDEDVFAFIVREFDSALSKVEAADQEDLRIAKFTALGMWRFLPNRYKNLKEFDELHSEEAGSVELDTDIQYTYKFDGRLKKAGVWWVREFKTTGMSQRQFEGRARTSGQATGYVWAANKQGYKVEGVMYDCIKKPLLRKSRRESCNDFGKRIMLDYKTRADYYYSRHYTYRNPTHLEQFEDDMKQLALELRQREAADAFYRNPDQCWNFNYPCPYMPICFERSPDPLTLQLYFTEGG